ncbi:MAG TPA: hypothetical protein VNK24_08995 [Elusimicrobiota bacterium]|nr:hypothetical protein [Elusimicrobiota bacterium]
MKRLWILSVLIPFSGCVRLSTYRKLQGRQQETAQSLRVSQSDNAKLQKQNDALSSDLDTARKQMAELVSDLKSDLAQAQAGIAAAMNRLNGQNAESSGAEKTVATPAPAAVSSAKPSPQSAATAQQTQAAKQP